MHKYSYLLLKQHLGTNIPQIKEIDWYRGQDKNTVKGALKISPGLYFRYSGTETRATGNGIYEGDVELDLILVQDNLYDGDKRIDDPNNIDHLDLVDEINKFMTGHSDYLSSLPQFVGLKNTELDYKPFNSITRIFIDPPHDPGNIMKTTQTFRFHAKDYSGNRIWTEAVNIAMKIENFEI